MTVKSRLTAREAAVLGVCTALMFGAKVAMTSLPNIEPVSLMIIVFTRFFKGRALLIIYAYVLLEGFFYGFGSWWICYLYVWAILFAAAWLLHSLDNALGYAMLSGIFGLCFGGLCSLTYLFVLGPAGALAYFLNGIPFDLAHCAGNFTLALFLYRPLMRAMTRAGKAVFSGGTGSLDR